MPLVLVIAITIVCRLTSLDLWVSQLFYSESEQAFWFGGTFVGGVIYYFAPLPGVVIASFGIAIFILGPWIEPLRPWRKQCLLFALVVIIGPGLLINSLLKPHWNRPRPSQLVEFGGRTTYVPPAMVSNHENAKSFPSGHASMGFVFMAPAFLIFRHRPWLAGSFLFLGLFLGGGIGVCRIAEGGHFLSDVVWSGAIVYYCCLAVFLGIQSWREPREISPPRLLELPREPESLEFEPQRRQTAREIAQAPAA
ncbi:MAG: phosphatase PAP2 family protein [Pirellulaceae bacterium]